MHFLETIGGHFRQTPAKSELERQFRDSYQLAEAESMSRVIGILLLMFHCSAIVTLPIVAMPSIANVLLAAHAALLLLNLIGWSLYRGGQQNVMITTAQSFALQLVHTGMAIYYVQTFPGGTGFMVFISVITLAMTLTVYQLRRYRLLRWLPGPISFLILFFLLPRTAEFIVPIGIFLALSLFQSAVLITQSNAIEYVARAEFKLRKATIPGHVMLRRTWNVDDLSELQRPESIRCVSIVLHWRQLWRINRLENMDAVRTVSDSLGSLLRTKLTELLPESNFFIDWASDTVEITIVITDTCSEALAVEAAIQCAYESLLARQEVHDTFGFPSGLDIGIGVGSAFLAVCGPLSIQRTMIDGKALRQAQAACEQAQILRANGAYLDRILMTQAVRDLLPPSYENMAIPTADEHWLIAAPQSEAA